MQRFMVLEGTPISVETNAGEKFSAEAPQDFVFDTLQAIVSRATSASPVFEFQANGLRFRVDANHVVRLSSTQQRYYDQAHSWTGPPLRRRPR